MMLTTVRRLWGHCSEAPSGVGPVSILDQRGKLTAMRQYGKR